ARTMLAGAGSLGVLADYLADRFGVRHDVAGMVTLGQIPHATLSMGKGLFDEADPDFVGTYSGAASPKPVRAAIEEADVTICLGVRFTDTTTAGCSQQLNPERTIDVQPFGARIGSRVFAPLPMRDAVTALAGIVRGLGRSWARPELSQAPAGDVRKPTGQLGH